MHENVQISRSHHAFEFLFVMGLLVFVLTSPALATAQTTNTLGLKILNEKVSPGGMLQMKLTVTEPKPILKGNQRLNFSSTFLGAPAGIHLDSPKGDVSGVMVVGNGTSQMFFSSPLSSFGTNLDYPILTMAMPVLSTAVVGKKVTLALDGVNSSWLDPSSSPYPLELKSGVMTVGGSLSVSNIVPGSGVVPAGTPITITGIGFQPDVVVNVNNATVSSFQFVSSTQIKFTLSTAVEMESRRVRVKKPTTNETVTYYSYQRTAEVGESTHALVAASYPLFSHAKWTQAFLKPVASGTKFSALALQNTRTTGVTVTLSLLSGTGNLLASKTVSLPGRSKIVRDMKEFFSGAKTGTEIRITCPVAIQVLGMLGDDASRIVLPVAPSATR